MVNPQQQELIWNEAINSSPGKVNIFEGVDPDSEVFTCLWLVQKNAFHFDSLGDYDYHEVSQHLDKLRIKYEIKFGNRMSLHLKN